MTDPLDWIDAEAAARSKRKLIRGLVPSGPSGGGRFTRDGRTVVNFGSNDYLGLAADPRLALAARTAAEAYGWGAGASPLISGWTECHEQLARDLADFEHTEAAVVFPTGYAANLGTIPALVGAGDVIYSDRLNHACLIDGMRLSRATIRVYPHNDADHLAALLARERLEFRRALIATDGVFSMDGDLAPLADLADLADRFSAILVVDEAHGTGVLGEDGRGAASEAAVAERVPVRVGTLSKALGGLGGFVAGSRRLIDHLVNHARTLIYSTALPPPAAAAAREALAIVVREPWRREQVRVLADRLRGQLASQGHPVGPPRGPIVPVVLGDPGAALSMSARLLEDGVFVPAIRPPTVPEGASRLRITLTAAHSSEDVDALCDALTRFL